MGVILLKNNAPLLFAVKKRGNGYSKYVFLQEYVFREKYVFLFLFTTCP